MIMYDFYIIDDTYIDDYLIEPLTLINYVIHLLLFTRHYKY